MNCREIIEYTNIIDVSQDIFSMATWLASAPYAYAGYKGCHCNNLLSIDGVEMSGKLKIYFSNLSKVGNNVE